jgi:hypothetical protein
MNVELTHPNAAAVVYYAELMGLEAEQFLNRFLAEFLLSRFADPRSGEAEPFLLGFKFRDRQTAERLAGWVKERLTIPNGRDTLEVEVVELPEGGFKVRAAWIGDGSMYKLSD